MGVMCKMLGWLGERSALQYSGWTSKSRIMRVTSVYRKAPNGRCLPIQRGGCRSGIGRKITGNGWSLGRGLQKNDITRSTQNYLQLRSMQFEDWRIIMALGPDGTNSLETARQLLENPGVWKEFWTQKGIDHLKSEHLRESMGAPKANERLTAENKEYLKCRCAYERALSSNYVQIE